METMLAAVLHDFNDLRLEEVPMPVPRDPGDAVVKIKACGICQTDYKAVRGIRRNVTFPTIVGHEASGVVAAIGSAVKYFKEGDEVIVQPSGYCGCCRNCRTGNTHHCESAFVIGGDRPGKEVRDGCLAEYTVVPSHCCLCHKPQSFSFDAAALTQPLAGAWKGVIHTSQMQVGEDVVIIGVGGIGILCLMVAHAAGAGRLIAIDSSGQARGTALKLGATHALDPTEPNIRGRVYEIMPDGPDLIVEAAGPIEAVRTMIDLRRRGTRWNIFGITTHETFALDGGQEHFLEARMDSSFGTSAEAMEQAIRLMERNLVDPEPIISHRLPLSQIHDAMDIMGTPNRNKVVIHP